MHKHRWVNGPVGPRFRCRLGMHAYMTTEKTGTKYEECLYCQKVALANRFYY